MRTIHLADLIVQKVRCRQEWRASLRGQRIWYVGASPSSAIRAALLAFVCEVGPYEDRRVKVRPAPTKRSHLPAVLGCDEEAEARP